MTDRYYVKRSPGGHTLVRAVPSAEKPHDASKDDRVSGEVIHTGDKLTFWAQLKELGYIWVQDGSFGRKYWTKK